MTDAEKVQAALDELMLVETYLPINREEVAIARALAILRGRPLNDDPPDIGPG